MLELRIDSLGGLGDGIGHYNGKPVFVEKTTAGDCVEAELTEENAQHSRARLTRVIQPGPDRQAAPCPYFSRCGGCSLQHLTNDAYRYFKHRVLQDALSYAGIESQAQWRFLPAASRRRVEFHFSPDNKLALYESRSHTPVPVNACLILNPRISVILPDIQGALSIWQSPVFRSLKITAADSGYEITLSGEDLKAARLLAEKLGSLDARILFQKTGGSSTSLHEAPLTMYLGGYHIPLPPNAFLQASSEGQRLLTEWAVEAMEGCARVVDLFCGMGSYSFPLSRNASVLAIEGQQDMVNAVLQGAQAHNIPRLKAQQRDLFKKPLSAAELHAFDGVVINPPRLGARAQVEEIVKAKTKKVAMISCNPATFSRDAKALRSAGYRVSSLMAVDQFVYSPHLEICALFMR